MTRRFLAAVGVGLVATVGFVAGQELGFPNVKRLGRATVQYRDTQGLHIVVNYDFSQRSHNTPWLLVDFAGRSERRLVLDREHFKLVSSSGEWFPVASQRHFLDDSQKIRSLRQNAANWRRDLGSYLGALERRDALKFFALPGEGIVITGALLQKDRNTFGELYFEMPRGSWDAGDYALLIEHPDARVKLPLTLN